MKITRVLYYIAQIAIGFIIFCGVMALTNEDKTLPTWIILVCTGIMWGALLVAMFLLKKDLRDEM